MTGVSGWKSILGTGYQLTLSGVRCTQWSFYAQQGQVPLETTHLTFEATQVTATGP